MPELPEVETIVRDLRPHVTGRTIVGLPYTHWDKTFATGKPSQVERRLKGRTFAGVERRAKRIVFVLDSGDRLVVSLRMTGQLIFQKKSEEPNSFTRFVLAMDRGFVRFEDARKFGRVWLFSPLEWEEESAKLGPEPLAMTEAEFVKLLRGRKGMLKAMLLDQKVLAGVGNIYADEALWHARLHPRRRAEKLTDKQRAALFAGVVHVLEKGIRNRGTSIDDYVGGNGEMGNNQGSLQAYGRGGEPCSRCQTPIKKITSGQRGTHYCPKCQPSPR